MTKNSLTALNQELAHALPFGVELLSGEDLDNISGGGSATPGFTQTQQCQVGDTDLGANDDIPTWV